MESKYVETAKDRNAERTYTIGVMSIPMGAIWRI